MNTNSSSQVPVANRTIRARSNELRWLAMAAALVVGGFLFAAGTGLLGESFAPFALKFEKLFHCNSDLTPSGYQFHRLIRSAAYSCLLLPTIPILARKMSISDAVALGILALGMLLRIDLWLTKSFWCDTWSLKAGILTHSAWEILTGSLGFNQSAPVGFSLLEKVIGEITNYSGLALTFPLLICGCISLVLLYRIVSVAFVHRRGIHFWTILFVFALNPAFVCYSAEFKPYGIDLLMAATAMWIVLRSQTHGVRWTRLCLFTATIPFFSLASFFVLPLLYLALLVQAHFNRKTTVRLLICGTVSVPFTLLALIHAFTTMPAVMDDIQELFAPVAVSREAFLWWTGRFLHFFRGPTYFGFTVWSISSPAILLSAIPISLFAIGAWKKRREPWLWMSLGVIAVAFAASACHYWKINPGTGATGGRLILFLAPFAYLPLACGLEWVTGKHPRCSRVISTFALASAVLYFAQQTTCSCPMSEIASDISLKWKTRDLIVTDEIMLLSILHENPSFAKHASQDIRMIYSNSTYDDREFSSLDGFLPGIQRFLADDETSSLMREVETRNAEGNQYFATFYPIHRKSVSVARTLDERFCGGTEKRTGWCWYARKEPKARKGCM